MSTDVLDQEETLFCLRLGNKHGTNLGSKNTCLFQGTTFYLITHELNPHLCFTGTLLEVQTQYLHRCLAACTQPLAEGDGDAELTELTRTP